MPQVELLGQLPPDIALGSPCGRPGRTAATVQAAGVGVPTVETAPTDGMSLPGGWNLTRYRWFARRNAVPGVYLERYAGGWYDPRGGLGGVAGRPTVRLQHE